MTLLTQNVFLVLNFENDSSSHLWQNFYVTPVRRVFMFNAEFYSEFGAEVLISHDPLAVSRFARISSLLICVF